MYFYASSWNRHKWYLELRSCNNYLHSLIPNWEIWNWLWYKSIHETTLHETFEHNFKLLTSTFLNHAIFLLLHLQQTKRFKKNGKYLCFSSDVVNLCTTTSFCKIHVIEYHVLYQSTFYFAFKNTFCNSSLSSNWLNK